MKDEKQLHLSLPLIVGKPASFELNDSEAFQLTIPAMVFVDLFRTVTCEGKQVVLYRGCFSHFMSTTAAPFVSCKG
jgi:hypothetical protein